MNHLNASMRISTKRACLAFVCALLLGGVTATQAQCPPDPNKILPAGTTCLAGKDMNGAFFLIAKPANYNGSLVLWNHGYTLSPPAKLTVDDLGPTGSLVGLGYAAAASSYRPDPIGLGGWAVADAAADTENLRLQFVRIFGRPKLTFVTGASEGGLVTAMIAEVYGTDAKGNLNYDGALPLCGPLAGGRRNWYGGFDLRVVYQYYCRNLPRDSEPQYQLYLGLAPANKLTLDDVVLRINECTGILLPEGSRAAQQQRNLNNILAVTKIPESFLLTDMGFATFALQELVLIRLAGLSPVTNLGVQYTDSDDDLALNSGVFRAGANPLAAQFLSSAYDPTGKVAMPTLALHTISDGLVIVENEAAYDEVRSEAKTSANLLQIYTDHNGHCEFTATEFLAAFQSLVSWVMTQKKPTVEDVAVLCDQIPEIPSPGDPAAKGEHCDFNTTFRPEAFETRILPRDP